MTFRVLSLGTVLFLIYWVLSFVFHNSLYFQIAYLNQVFFFPWNIHPEDCPIMKFSQTNIYCVYYLDQERTSLASFSEGPLPTIIVYLIIPPIHFLAPIMLIYLFIYYLDADLSVVCLSLSYVSSTSQALCLYLSIFTHCHCVWHVQCIDTYQSLSKCC